MRRAVVAVIIGGFTFGGIGMGLGHQPVIVGAGPTADVRHANNNARLTAAIRPVKNTGKKASKNKGKKANKKTEKKTGRTHKKTAGKAIRTAKKTIEYEGVEFSVPASWPVYWLNKDPDQCVRYDTNAVYVGTPGPNQNCPPGLIGRKDTISIGGPAASPALPAQATSPAGSSPAGSSPAGSSPAGSAQTGSAQTGSEPAGSAQAPAMAYQRASVQDRPAGTSMAPGTIVQNPELHEFAVAMPASAPSVNATYGTDPALVEQTLATLRQVRPQSAALGAAKLSSAVKAKNPAWPKNPAPPPAGTWPWSTDEPTPEPSATSPVLTNDPSPTPSPSPSPSPPPSQNAPNGSQAGFDTCTAPSLQAMKAWRAKYSATAIYIGGQMVACDAGNLSASWVQQAEAMGWSLLPTFVGLQAPCNSFSGKINAKQAASQGTADANQAVADAKLYGLGAGSPVYYDMEAYDHTNASCRTAVLTFLDAWDRQVEAEGYQSGVYSSADAAIADLQATATIAGHPLAEPQAIWFALWDNANNLTGSPYMTSSVWPVSDRSKQYAGNRTVKVGGISLDIDADWVDSAVARG
jgi:hypothetical protein